MMKLIMNFFAGVGVLFLGQVYGSDADALSGEQAKNSDQKEEVKNPTSVSGAAAQISYKKETDAERRERELRTDPFRPKVIGGF